MRARWGAGGVMVAAGVASHGALASGWVGLAVGLAAVQAVALGVVVSGWWRRVGAGVAAVLLGALAAGAMRSGEVGLLAMAGVAHAVLYAGLLWGFGASLGAGREAVITGFARRLNPSFHAGMVPYTRGVTWVWVGFFAGQLVGSAVLLGLAPRVWAVLVTTLHLPLAMAVLAGEVAVRRWRWRHQRVTGLVETIRGVRRMTAPR